MSVDDGVSAGSYVLVDAPQSRLARRFVGVAASVSVRARNSYSLQGNSSRILAASGPAPTTRSPGTTGDDVNPAPLSLLRTTVAHVRSERLEIAEPPDESTVAAKIVELDDLYDGLQSGRWLIVAGDRADLLDADGDPIPGIEARELMMLAGVRQIAGVGQRTHTELTLERPLANAYRRSTVRIFANVAKATHGETQEEPLGSGDAARTLQTFTLKRDPLTYIPAATPDGVATTLEARVNLVRWHETETLVAAAPSDRAYVVRVSEDGSTTLTFGTGEHGARLPTGVAERAGEVSQRHRQAGQRQGRCDHACWRRGSSACAR